jgi:2-dehydro-3-deoxyphosphogluconate aldolase / (4S)-4-hydroxy-2-oxoglutarate aldolase
MQTSTVDRVLDIIQISGVVAIVRLSDLSKAVGLSKALVEGGITALEFTLTNRDALRVISEVRNALPEFANGQATIGAGTVRNPEDAQASIDAGAEFIVAPSTNLKTIDVCLQHGVPVMPGALTPTEIETAAQAGAQVIKIFPARSFGPAYIKDLLGPMPELKLMPTGGVDLNNTDEFIENGAFGVGIGGNLVDAKRIAAEDWVGLTATAHSYVQAVKAGRRTK